MARAAYVGVSAKARKVKNIYVGVNGVARKIKKAYVGVNGVAKQFYPTKPVYISFTSTSTSPIPKSWSGSGTAANSSYTASNSYGTWTITNLQAAADKVSNAFDGSTSTYSRSDNTSGSYNVKVSCPTNVGVKPTKFYASVKNIKANATIVAGSSTTLYTHTSAIANTQTAINATVSTTSYWTNFTFKTTANSARAFIYEFNFASGEIKDNR